MEKKSEWMINLLELLVDTVLRALSIARISAEMMGTSLRCIFWRFFFCTTSSSVAVFGAICVDVGIVRVLYEDEKFFLDILRVERFF